MALDLTLEEKRAMVRESILNLKRQAFTVELDLVANRGLKPSELAPLREKRDALEAGIRNLEVEYADLLADELTVEA